MKKNLGRILFFFAVLCCTLCGRTPVRAAMTDVPVSANNTVPVRVNVGDTGHIQPITDNLLDAFGQPVVVARWGYTVNADGWGEQNAVRVDESGYYQAVSSGTVTVTVTGWSQTGQVVYTSYCQFVVVIDMTNVTLASDQISGYTTDNDAFTAKIAVNSQILLNEENSEFTYSVEDDEMSMGCQLLDNELVVTVNTPGSTALTVTINGKEFVIRVDVTNLEITKRGVTTAKGKKISLKIKGTSDQPVWTSSDSGVAKVSRDGTVRCRKTGNAVITATLGDIRLGCAVSVVSPALYKTVNAAKKIGANWKYSQPRRMQNGYYDCSSLVWRTYKKMGKTFGDSSYAPVAANIAKWCAKHKKMVTKSYTWNQIQKMKLRPGDLLFKTGQKNGRYKGIYHVEMFVGYAVSHYDEIGKPVLTEQWAAREEDYGGGGYPIARP